MTSISKNSFIEQGNALGGNRLLLWLGLAALAILGAVLLGVSKMLDVEDLFKEQNTRD